MNTRSLTCFIKQWYSYIAFASVTFFSSTLSAQTIANFTLTQRTGCAPISINFTDISSGGSVTGRQWDLGNGAIANTDTAVGANYLTARKYYITLKVTFSNGDKKTKTDSVIIYPKPLADFAADDTAGCIAHQVKFADLSFTPTGTINSWTWDFGAGGDTVRNPAFLYNTPGNYNISLIVKNSWGCQSDAASRFQYIRVYNSPVPAFSPSANFSCNDTLTVLFNNTTTRGSTANNYKWYFGDGDSSNLKSPSHLYDAAGLYTVKLIASVGKTCSSNTTRVISTGNVAPFFTSAPDTVCNNTAISFTGSAVPAPSGLQWIFSDNGATRSGSTVNYSFAFPGDYIVSLIAFNNQGCSDTITKSIHVNAGANLTPFFSTAPDTVCVNSSIFFEGSSNPAPASLKWIFSDNGAVQDNSPTSHTFASPDDYNVSLIAFNTRGCADTITKPIHVKAGPVASFIPQKMNGCDTPFTVRFNNTSPPGTNLAFTWNFGDGSPLVIRTNKSSVPHTYRSFGNFTVTLTARDTLVGCGGVAATFSNIRVFKPAVDFTYVPPGGCSPLQVSFTAQVNNLIVPVISYVWSYGDGTPNDTLLSNVANHLYETGGIFNPTVTIITAECTFTSVAKQVDVISICDDDGSGDVGGGGGGGGSFIIEKSCTDKYRVEFSDTVRNKIVKSWDFGDGSPLLTSAPLNPVAYKYLDSLKIHLVTEIRLDTITGITDTVRKRIIIIDEKANFLPDQISICNNTSVSFKTVSIDSSRIKKYTWDFGDSTARLVINNEQNFNTYGLYLNGNTSHTYDTLGLFNVKLIIEDKLGCLDSLTYSTPITVGGPVADFSGLIQSSCLVPVKVIFTDSSRQNGIIPITGWQWVFGDGAVYNTTVDTSISHLYGVGSYTVSLKVTDSVGCMSTIAKPLMVPVNTTGPRAGFTASPLASCTSPLTVAFNDTSAQNANVPIAQWQWTFGDGSPVFTTTRDTAVTHIYTGNTNHNFYDVTLTITDSFGCVSSVTKAAYIKLYRPTADFFSYDTLKCGNFNVFLYNYASAYNATYAWDYGDSSFSTDFYGLHTYASEGMYNIKLVVKDENGCTDSLSRPSYIKLVTPVADFKVGDTTKCAPTAITFSDSSKYSSSYEWDFGDGGTGSTEKNPSPKIYALPGIYKVTLKVKGLNNCVDTIFKWIRVRGPIATLAALTGNGCKPYKINMKVTGSYISTYAWDYNDGTPVNPSLTDSNVFHTYTIAGKYIPNVVLTSPEGCPFTLRAPDTVVVDEASAGFSFNKNAFCDSGYVTFTNLSVTTSFSSLKYKWDFGDGTTDTAQTPLPNLYNDPDKYTVKLAVKSAYGCIDSVVQTNAITVNASPRAAIKGDSTICLMPSGKLIYTSNIASADPIIKYIWMIDGDSVANVANLNYNYRIPGNHILTLHMQTVNSCNYTTSKNIIIDSISTDFGIDSARFCGNGTVSFNNLTKHYSPVTGYLWSFGDGATSPALNALHTYAVPGNYTVKLVGATGNGCRDSTVYTDTIKVFKFPAAAINGSSVICLTPSTTLQYTSTVTSIDPVIKYRWTIDSDSVANTADLNYNYHMPGAHMISLHVTTVNGCSFTVSKNVIIDSVRAGFSIVNPNICGDTGTIRLKNLSASRFDNNTYLWNFGDGQSSTDAEPAHFYSAAGRYIVSLKATTANGCENTFVSADTVIIYKATTVTISGDSEKCMQNILTYRANVISQDEVTSYNWKLNNSSISTGDTALYHFASAGTYSLQLDINTRFGCKFTASKTIVIHPLPIPNAGPDTAICLGGTITLHSSDGLNYQWQPSSTLQKVNTATPAATPITTTDYYVIVTNGMVVFKKIP